MPTTWPTVLASGDFAADHRCTTTRAVQLRDRGEVLRQTPFEFNINGNISAPSVQFRALPITAPMVGTTIKGIFLNGGGTTGQARFKLSGVSDLVIGTTRSADAGAEIVVDVYVDPAVITAAVVPELGSSSPIRLGLEVVSGLFQNVVAGPVGLNCWCED